MQFILSLLVCNFVIILNLQLKRARNPDWRTIFSVASTVPAVTNIRISEYLNAGGIARLYEFKTTENLNTFAVTSPTPPAWMIAFLLTTVSAISYRTSKWLAAYVMEVSLIPITIPIEFGMSRTNIANYSRRMMTINRGISRQACVLR